MLTSQQIAVGTAMKLASDGKQSDPDNLLALIIFIAVIFIIYYIVDWWRWSR